jgi:hypothetical protein
MIDDWLDGRRDFTGGRCDGYPQVPRQRTGGAAAVPVIVSNSRVQGRTGKGTLNSFA